MPDLAIPTGVKNQFFNYLLRLLTSWAIVYDIYYLPVQHRRQGETSTEFARRVQCLIAEAASCPPASFDGGLLYKQAEKTKLLKLAQHNCAQQIMIRKNIVENICIHVQPQEIINTEDFIPKTIIENLAIPVQIDFPSSAASSSSCMSNGFTRLSKEDSTEEQGSSEGQSSSVSLLEKICKWMRKKNMMTGLY
uniref:Uncharacterized protein n=1 Tax=Ditylenchus dipsaci TaxID=166011 RepID=A0A915DNT7_9BILA